MVSREAQGNSIQQSYCHSWQAALGNLVVALKSPFGHRAIKLFTAFTSTTMQNQGLCCLQTNACEAVYGLGYTPDCIAMPRLTLNWTVW